jgi:hypothetical protein
MASGNAALKEQALAILQAGRREISAEAKWLRHELNPKHAAERITRDHTGTVLLAAFGVGLVVPLLLIPKKKSHHHDEWMEALSAAQKKQLKKAEKPRVGAAAYLAGLVTKAVTPILVKQGLHLWDHFQKTKLSPDARPARYA